MPAKITSTIPSAVWWIVALCLLLLTIAVSLQILASDSVELSTDGVRMETSPSEPEEPQVDYNGRKGGWQDSVQQGKQ